MDFLVIKKNGKFDFAKFYGQVTEFVSVDEVNCNHCGKGIIFEPTLDLFMEMRKLLGKPIPINSWYRCETYQQQLLKTNPNAAKNSPHTTGAAIDLAIPKGETAVTLERLAEQAAANLGLPKPRIGRKQYNDAFVHVDLVFMLYAPYWKNPSPSAWKSGVKW